jgi:hypothetical protein
VEPPSKYVEGVAAFSDFYPKTMWRSRFIYVYIIIIRN